MEFNIQSTEELPLLVEKLLAFANGRKKIFFIGEIGAGKTTFIQAFCRHFQVNENVTSPTFSLINEYTYLDENQKEQLIHHIDLYRLENQQEALDIGIEDYLYDGDYCLIEWPDLVENLLSEEVVIIKIEILNDSSRKILFL